MQLTDQLSAPADLTWRLHQNCYGIDGDRWNPVGSGEPDMGEAARRHQTAAKQNLSERER